MGKNGGKKLENKKRKKNVEFSSTGLNIEVNRLICKFVFRLNTGNNRKLPYSDSFHTVAVGQRSGFLLVKHISD